MLIRYFYKVPLNTIPVVSNTPMPSVHGPGRISESETFKQVIHEQLVFDIRAYPGFSK